MASANYHVNPPLPNLAQPRQGYMPLNQAGMELANLAAWHQQRLGQMGYLASPPEGSIALPLGMPANPAATFRRVWLDEPPGSIPFDEQQTAVFTGIAGTQQTVLTILVPAGYDGVIKWISNNIGAGEVFGEPFVPGTITWSLQNNGRAIRNFGVILQEKGTIAQGREISPIRIFANQRITYLVTEVVGGLTGTTVVSLSGYFYPSKGVS